MDRPLDVEDTLIASLARLRLGQVSSLKGDWLHLPDWYQDFLRGHQLGTVLGSKQRGIVCPGSCLSTPLSQGRGQDPDAPPEPLMAGWAAHEKDVPHVKGMGRPQGK